MSRRFLPAIWAFTLLWLMMQVPAMAATYVVAPFKVSGSQGYSYLGQAVPSMLTSRLFLQGKFEPCERQDAALKEKSPASREAAAALGKKFKADYVIWGDITVMGDQASLDVSAITPEGKVWKDAVTSPVNALIGGLQNMADKINVGVFGRTDVARASAPAGGPSSPNSAFMVNETYGKANTGAYLNPSLRYQGTEDSLSQVRSQMLKFECLGSEIADIDGDGKNEVLMLSPHDLYVYTWKDGNRLEERGKYRLPASMRPVLVRAYKDMNKQYIILSGHDENNRCATSQVLQFVNGKFKVIIKSIDRYLNVVSLPPMYAPVLIGQDSDRSSTVSGRVYEVQIVDGKAVRRGNISKLPKEATVFNFSWIPGEKGKPDHLTLVSENDTLMTYNNKGQRLSVTEDQYSSSSVYIIGDRGIGNLNTDEDDNIMTYVPMRMPVADLDRDGRYELIASKPITTAGKLFGNYRTYPQGEIHAMLWDGMGLNLLWKTRRIKGTVADVNLADVDNNGKLDLVVTVNAYAGVMNGTQTRCA
ncbi:MAG: VCBS repeat-containing protein, partial [Mailhella sp.]|nr:VCBS repeat-containing protein [Mailhella sp.]